MSARDEAFGRYISRVFFRANPQPSEKPRVVTVEEQEAFYAGWTAAEEHRPDTADSRPGAS